MPRKKNDGRGRLGGRVKGSPNKVTSSVKEWLVEVINQNRPQMEADIRALEPKDRLQILEKFMQYAIPKQQAVSAKVDIDTLSDEQLDLLVSELTKDVRPDTGHTTPQQDTD